MPAAPVVRLPMPGADVVLHAAIDLPLPPAALLDELLASVPWRQDRVRLFGREVPQPRLTAWFGDEDAHYRYSGLSLAPIAWTPRLAALRDLVSAVADAAGPPFNACLLNRYRDGRDAIGFHADDEPELGPAPVIATLSLGATRAIAFRPRDRALAGTVRVEPPAGSLLVMRGETQARWLHGIARTARPVGERVSLTFRRVHPAPR